MASTLDRKDLELDDILDMIAELDERYETGPAAVLCEAPSLVDPSKPLLILVHPGDVLVPKEAKNFHADYEGSVLKSTLCQMYQGAEGLRLIAEGWETCVIHRGSCSQLHDDANTDETFLEFVRAIWEKGTVLYGDELAKVSGWISKHLRCAARPRILVTGAYHMEDGCIDAVVHELRRLHPALDIQISKHSAKGDF